MGFFKSKPEAPEDDSLVGLLADSGLDARDHKRVLRTLAAGEAEIARIRSDEGLDMIVANWYGDELALVSPSAVTIVNNKGEIEGRLEHAAIEQARILPAPDYVFLEMLTTEAVQQYYAWLESAAGQDYDEHGSVASSAGVAPEEYLLIEVATTGVAAQLRDAIEQRRPPGPQ